MGGQEICDQLGEVLVVQVTDGQVHCDRHRSAAVDPGARLFQGAVNQ